MAKKGTNTIKGIVEEYTKVLDIPFINETLELKDVDLKISKQVIKNIGEWALNGSSNDEIRQNLELNNAQWKMLLSICPTLVMVMNSSRALADVLVAGSLVQTAIGGKKVKKQQAIKLRDFDENGRAMGEHVEIIWVEEELPPNPILLKFLAENKLSEKFGGEQINNSGTYREMINKFTPEEIALLEASKNGELNGKN